MATKKTTKATANTTTTPEKTVPAKKTATKETTIENTPVSTTPVKAEPAKKAPAKKTVKKEIKTNLVVQYAGKEAEEKDLIASVKKAWTKSGKKVGDIKTMTLYIKPEDNAVYYVINKEHTGSVEL